MARRRLRLRIRRISVNILRYHPAARDAEGKNNRARDAVVLGTRENIAAREFYVQFGDPTRVVFVLPRIFV